MPTRVWGSGVLRFILVFAIGSFACIFLSSNAVSADQSVTAQQILQATGVKGGLIVHLGCGDGKLTAALRANDSYLVHGLDADAGNIEKARNHIRPLGIYGKVSVERWDKPYLPYIDNFVNLIVSENPGKISMEEINRVLAPEGVAYVKQGGKWTKIVKPRPKEIDEWTHYLHDASNNAVAHDSVVDLPRRLQWIGSPKWARHHDHMASVSALVSAGGRIFYIVDEGLKASLLTPSKWFLAGRDAFNGTILWKQPMKNWHNQLWPYKSGPTQLTRRLVASGERVYATLELDAPLTQLDAATGKIIQVYKDTNATEEVIFSEGVLFVLVNKTPVEYKRKRFYGGEGGRWEVINKYGWDEKERSIMAIRAETGKVLWKKEYKVIPVTMAANKEYVFFHDGDSIICLDRRNGNRIWASSPVSRRKEIETAYGPNLILYKDVIVFAGGDGRMTALSMKDGEEMWHSSHPASGHLSQEDLFVISGIVWAGEIAGNKDSGIFTGRDLYTGSIKSEFSPDVDTYWFHHRCYRSKATDKYILTSRTGIEFVDINKKSWTINHWIRGGCIYGIMPANGLIYNPPHSCGCYLEAKLYGLNAVAPASQTSTRQKGGAGDADRLEKGPAYAEASADRHAYSNESSGEDDWPTYRHDPARSGFTKISVPSSLGSLWQADLKSKKLTSMTIGEGRVFLASIDEHVVYSLDSNSGKILWSYTAGGRVDSPPTVYKGRVLFGSRDGWVYCLRSSDGKLIWRFCAAPEERKLMAFEQLESPWPVNGSVLVQDDVVYCVAGRSMFLDGGMYMYKLDPITGQRLCGVVMDDRDPKTGKDLQEKVRGLDMAVTLPDILSSDGKYIYMRSQRFDKQCVRSRIGYMGVERQEGAGQHLFSSVGFLDDYWWHRSYWIYGKAVASGAGGWFLAGKKAPAGRMLVFDESSIYGYGRQFKYYRWNTPLEYHLFSSEKDLKFAKVEQEGEKKKKRKKNPEPVYNWSKEISIHPMAMILADKMFFIAGPPDLVDEEKAFRRFSKDETQAQLKEQGLSLEGKKGAVLWAVSASDGEKKAEYKLEFPPVWDGMAAAGGRLYIATIDGKVTCMGEK